MTAECRPVYVQVRSHSCSRGGDTLLDEISDERRKILRDMVENTNLTMNSPKAYMQPSVVLGQTMSPLPWSLMSVLTKSLTNYCRMEEGWNTEGHPVSAILTKPFSLDELATGLSLLKPGKAAGLDDLLTEMLQHIGSKAKSWLLGMLNEYTRTKHIPPIWRKAKVIPIPKRGNDPCSPKSYSPISLLCIPYKLYERLILMRISPLSMRS